MLHQIIVTYLIPLLIYGAITGLANFVLSRKSQVELWAEAHPKAAALQKLLRAIGLDPWQIISAISLWATSKLPDAQRSEFLKATDPKPAAKPPSNPMGPMGGMLAIAFILGACSTTKPPCDQAKLAAVVAICTAQSQQCKSAGKSEAECSSLAACDDEISAACGAGK